MALEVTGVPVIVADPSMSVGSYLKVTSLPVYSGGTGTVTYSYKWKGRNAASGGTPDDWNPGPFTEFSPYDIDSIPDFYIDRAGTEYQLGIKAVDEDGTDVRSFSQITAPSSGTISRGQYVQTDKDNVPVDPQPGDVEITDAYGNVFDNFNSDYIAREVDNTALNPQPAYQNLGYTSRTVDNQPSSPPFEPGATQWIARGVDNVERTPQPYVRSPLFPAGTPESFVIQTVFDVILTVEQNETVIVAENDINEIQLVLNSSDRGSLAAIANYHL